ncbi:hypothetical protein [Streptomyces californicus]|uniref:hypothetical protein n=1 Tax=Streptomyces californicus TaxID=67351 RepID=UPI0037B7BA74
MATDSGCRGFQEFFQSWTDPTWGDWAHTGIHAGDLNGEGRDDLAAVRDYTDGRMKMWTWTAKTGGTFNSPLGSWNPATGWNYDRLTLIGQHH